MSAQSPDLLLAAKACSIRVICWDSSRSAYRVEGAQSSRWNPRNDDGDAMRLAAALKMSIDQGSDTVFAQHRTQGGFWINSPVISLKGRDRADAYREAICLCAIKVGERMP
ncbi:hypothetical protein [Stutzerimonas nitrititolerans]|uniref:hypothetical protein n=1 Tax=Stutzerimonas nitrititolerans TaxID=2482751 RepID=UPI0028AEA57A|nr:hypothetical protein [Stutzerimonas nitrititolerans]